jgi:hypothetical protein
VYRVAYGGVRLPKVDLGALKSEELVRLQLHPNDWYVRGARRLLQERGPDPAAHAALREMLKDNPDETRKLRALWALHATGGLTEELALAQLAAPHEYVRAWTIQLAAEDREISAEMLARWVTMAKEDPSPVVRLYFASALQRVPPASRWGVLEGLLGHAEDAADHNLPVMYWYAVEPLVAQDSARALALAAKCKIPKVREYIARRAASK